MAGNGKKTRNQVKKKGGAKSKKARTSAKTTEKKLLDKVDELEVNLAELNDKYLRLFSEFDNYRKRTNKERLDLLNTASEEVISDLLPVIDDFERGIKALNENDALESSVEGMTLIYNKLLGILTKKGLKPMKSIGETFDTDFHEAITNIPAPSEDLKGKVIDEIEKGYLLNGKVTRFAKVVVGQ
ncbi:MAG: nucleotide exchange factor GrpE [Bacteroidetes bacterium 4484_276]|nr:MAG: nucleotide exchange factor GrpE [Bacteroidetes bacterium 4484_276]OYT14026.1 MAG: nucleotide exchange factor GrpE [Bacteroidetes bacterium 4572_114]